MEIISTYLLATVMPASKPILNTMENLYEKEVNNMPEYIIGLPAFLAWFGCGIIALALFGFVYTRITKHDEITLMREGNTAASIGFMGVLIGYSLPLSSAAEHTATVGEFIVWATIGFMVQVAAYYVGSYLQPGLSKRIIENDTAAGVWKGGFAIAVGMNNAACMTY